MKQILFMMVITAGLLASCVKENTPTAPIDDRVDTLMASGLLQGVFMNGPYGSVSGQARIFEQENRYTLALENVRISNGPDLHVYISREIQPVNFIDLGSLQSIAGNQLYAIPGRPDFTQYKYALIHCQRFNHLFGSAELR